MSTINRSISSHRESRRSPSYNTHHEEDYVSWASHHSGRGERYHSPPRCHHDTKRVERDSCVSGARPHKCAPFHTVTRPCQVYVIVHHKFTPVIRHVPQATDLMAEIILLHAITARISAACLGCVLLYREIESIPEIFKPNDYTIKDIFEELYHRLYGATT